MRYPTIAVITALLTGTLAACDLSMPAASAGAGSSRNDDGESDDDVDCVDGIDAATGEECDGGPGANQDDGECEDGVDETGDPCDDEEEGQEEDEDGECEDGKDENGDPCTDDD